MKPLVAHRYLVTLMGFFATYCGFIYNDTLSMSINYFGTCMNMYARNPGEYIDMD